MEVGAISGSFGGQRTLAAIVFTDAVNYSGRVSTDEDTAVSLIRRDLDNMGRLCLEFEGKVIKSRGDGLMMLFTSAVQAVSCALEIQKSFSERAKQNPQEEGLLHRIGIHLGDVLISDGDALGDGVNVAARLEEESEAGCICMSQTVYDVVKNRLFLQAVKVGDLRLKNISEPVSAYKVSGLSVGRKHKHTPHWHWAAYTGAGLALVILGSVATAALMGRKQDPPVQHPPDLMSAIGKLISDGQAFDTANKSGKTPVHVNEAIPGDNAAELERVRKEEDKLTKDHEQLLQLIQRNAGAVQKSGRSTPSKPTPPAAKASGSVGTNSPPSAPDADPAVALSQIPKITPAVGFSSEWAQRFGAEMAKNAGKGIAPPTLPPNLADLKSMQGFDRAWKAYAKHFDFKGMEQWLDRNQAKVPSDAFIKDQFDLGRMEALTGFVQAQMAQYSASGPLNFKAVSGDASAWTDSNGQVLVKVPTGVTKKFRDMTPAQFVSLARGVINNMKGSISERLHWQNELRLYGKDFRGLGNAGKAGHPSSGTSPFDTSPND